ncbi:MAG: hypothetical protein HZB42_08285 [Sphingobacteriales bacterium]|nr:hypothetical protein [Sphingobacteriales bacterium]
MFNEARKIQLIERVIKITDESTLASIEKLLKKTSAHKKQKPAVKFSGALAGKKSMSPYKRKVLSDLKQAVKEMHLIKQGKLKARNAEDILNEL